MNALPEQQAAAAAASTISLPPGARPRVCVDVGGTKVAVSILTESGIVGKIAEPTVKTGGRDALGLQVLALIRQATAAQRIGLRDVEKIGISACGPFVATPNGIELATPNICGGIAGKERGLPNEWPTAVLEAPLREYFSSIAVVNDAAGAVEAERRWGALKDGDTPLRNCAYVTWSTGIGMGVCVDGVVLKGKSGNAGHGGHTIISDEAAALCGCGTRGDVESLIAGNAIPRRFGHLGYADAAALFSAYRQADAGAITIVDDLCRIMARLVFNITLLGDLSRIAMGGSVFFNNRDILLPKLRALAFTQFLAITEGVEIVPAHLGSAVGDYAALTLVM